MIAGQLERKTANTMTDPKTLSVEIAQIGKVGFAQDNEEFIEGMVALAVPINDAHCRMGVKLGVPCADPAHDHQQSDDSP